jgi:hypothetical protein
MTKTCIVPVLTLLLLLLGGLTDSHGFERTRTESGAAFFWPSAEVTLNLRVGCPSNGSLVDWGPCWDDAAGDAAARWSAAGAQFEFFIRRTSVPASLCAYDGLNTVGWASTDCSMPFGPGVLAVTMSWAHSSTGEMVDSDVVFNSNFDWSTYAGPQRGGAFDFHRVAVHEFGHVLGLDHPNEHGQVKQAIMNSPASDIDRLQADDIAGIRAIYGRAVAAAPKGSLENPGNRSFKSGIGVISGWVCDATRVEVAIGNTRSPVVYGTSRGDTASVCGDTNNGFVTLVNWNLLGDGVHTMRLVVDGVAIGLSEFKVTTFGQEFLRGASGAYSLLDFPRAGSRAMIEWEESSQNFVIRGRQ